MSNLEELQPLKRYKSVPHVYQKPERFSRTLSVNPDVPSIPQGISSEERDIKIAELERFIQNAQEINQGKNSYTADEIQTQDSSGKDAKFFYFIGRLNPPHNGHIKALKTLVEMANNEGSVPLILLGSGPGSKRTMDNPITFEAKESFIRSVLPGNYIIQKMTNPAKNVSDYIRNGLGESLSDINHITINHIAGGKDEDTTKLAFALKSAENTARELAPDTEILTDVKAIDAETTDSGAAMSATKVRKDAYNTVLTGSGFNGWPEQYKQFYGSNAEQIYNEILFPLQEIPETEKTDAIMQYITSGILPSSSSSLSKKRKRGGTKRKNRRYKTKTQRRKRRLTRRKY
jgi:nicotinamide mononucleotide adenylyltransferase